MCCSFRFPFASLRDCGILGSRCRYWTLKIFWNLKTEKTADQAEKYLELFVFRKIFLSLLSRAVFKIFSFSARSSDFWNWTSTQTPYERTWVRKKRAPSNRSCRDVPTPQYDIRNIIGRCRKVLFPMCVLALDGSCFMLDRDGASLFVNDSDEIVRWEWTLIF